MGFHLYSILYLLEIQSKLLDWLYDFYLIHNTRCQERKVRYYLYGYARGCGAVQGAVVVCLATAHQISSLSNNSLEIENKGEQVPKTKYEWSAFFS